MGIFDFFKAKEEAELKPKFVISEGIASMWHYHISNYGMHTRGLCGAKTMYTAIKYKDWRVPFGEHFPKKPTWCEECERLAK